MGINFYNTCIKHIYVMCICIAPKSINGTKWYSKPNPTTFSILTTTAILESLP